LSELRRTDRVSTLVKHLHSRKYWMKKMDKLVHAEFRLCGSLVAQHFGSNERVMNQISWLDREPYKHLPTEGQACR